MIDEGTTIAPGSSVTIDLDDEKRMLDATGGVLTISDADGNVVIDDMNYIGSPSAPYTSPPNGDSNDTGNGTAAAGV